MCIIRSRLLGPKVVHSCGQALELCIQRMILFVMDPARHRQDGVQAYMRSAQDRPGCRSSGSWLELFSARPTWPRSTNPTHLWGPRQLRSSTLRCLCRTTACSTHPRLQSCVPWYLVGMARERLRAMQPRCCDKSGSLDPNMSSHLRLLSRRRMQSSHDRTV